MANKKRLIDANDALERLKKAEQQMKVVSMLGCKAVPMEGVIDFIASRPTVEAVEVVHGRWVHRYNDSGEPIDDKWYCSECHMCNDHKRTWYCPNCGAKMDGDGNESA